MRGPRRPAREEPCAHAARTPDGRSGRARIPGHSRPRPRRGVGRGSGAFASPARNGQGPAPEPCGCATRSTANASGRRPDEPRSPPRRVPLWLLGLFTFCGTLGMHIFVPALPEAAKDLHATRRHGRTDDQSLHPGPGRRPIGLRAASDRFGRRPALLLGLSLFTIASIAGLFAPDAHTLVVARFFQGFGRMFGPGARPRHHPRHVAGARGRAAPRAGQCAGDRGPRDRSAHRRGAQRSLGMADDPHGADRAGRGQFRARVAHSAGDAAGGAVRQRLEIRARLCRPAALAAVSGLRPWRRLRDDPPLRLHRLRAFHLCRPPACAERKRRPLSCPPGLRALARQPSRKPVDRALSAQRVSGRRQRRQRRGGGFVPRPLDRRPGDSGRRHRNDVRVQRRRGRRGARRPCPGDQRKPARHGNGFRTLRFGPDGCRSGAGRARRPGRKPGARLRRRAPCRWRRGAGVVLDRAKPGRRRSSSRRAKPRPKRLAAAE